MCASDDGGGGGDGNANVDDLFFLTVIFFYKYLKLNRPFKTPRIKQEETEEVRSSLDIK